MTAAIHFNLTQSQTVRMAISFFFLLFFSMPFSTEPEMKLSSFLLSWVCVDGYIDDDSFHDIRANIFAFIQFTDILLKRSNYWQRQIML